MDRLGDREHREVGERFCWMWEFYLAAFEASFRFDDLVAFQFQLTRGLGTAPRTRGCLYASGSRPRKA